MSDPKRYTTDVGYGHEEDDGEFVLWDDYATLQAENERLRSGSFVTAVPSEEYEKLKAENELLRKAGNAMYDAAVQDSMGLWVMPAFEQWSKIKNETK